MIARRAWWGPLAVASALSAGALDAADVHSAVRVAVAVWFVLVCPGIAVVRLLRLDDAAAELALGVAVSIALAVAVGATTLYAGHWSPGVTLAVLVAITVAAAGAPLARARPWRRL
jgi:uncharacterized membrane protein